MPNALYKYDGTTWTKLFESSDTFDFSIYSPYGKDLLVEYEGKLYFPILDGADVILKQFDISSESFEDVMIIGDSNDVVTTMYVYEGIIMIAVYDTVTDMSSVKIYVPNKIKIEQNLVSGDGDVSQKLIKTDVDSISASKDGGITAFDKNFVIGILRGKFGYAFKYGNRVEPYTDLNKVDDIIGVTLKEIVDDVCSLMNMVFYVDGENKATVKVKDLVGASDRFMTVHQNTDHGNNYLESIDNSYNVKNNYRKIIINWQNLKFEENSPVYAGSAYELNNVFEYDSPIINDPITAMNIAVNLLKNFVAVEQIQTCLSLSHFLELTDNVSFDINESYIYIDKDVEYKLWKIEHDFTNKKTTLNILERKIVNEKESI